MVEVIHIPEQYWPEIEELPGDLRRIAEAIERHIPGHGVRLTLLLAQIFHGNPVYFRNIKPYLRAYRDDAIRAEYDQGGVTAKELAMSYRLCLRQVEKILAQPGSQGELEKKQMRLF